MHDQYGQGYGGQQGYAPPSGPPPGQYAPPSGPPPGYPPQQGYGYGAPSPQPPYGAPPQQPYGAPQQQGYGAPQQAPYGAPPQQGYGAPQQAPYGAPPQQGYGAPPQQGYGAPQQQGYGAPPQAPYGAPPQQSYGAPTAQAHPSPGYDPNYRVQVDTTQTADALRTAMKGMGTNENLLITTLSRTTDANIMAAVRTTYQQRHKRSLLADLKAETSGYFCEGLEAIARGPLAQDCHNLNEAISGPGTKESVLNDVLLGRTNADLNAIKLEYQKTYRRSLEADLRADLSMKTERLFMMVLAAERAPESAGVHPQQLEADVTEVQRATEGRMGADALAVCHLFSHRSDGQLRAIGHEYQRRYAKPLAKVIEKEFSGHMEEALLRMLGLAEDQAMTDAVALEETMKGAGTKDRLLVNRVVRLHWNRQHLAQVRGAYKKRFGKDLGARIRGETRGDYMKLLTTIVEA